ncbi:alpha-ketoglutarate-dependent dioxygenase abh1-like protein [Euroglyphus maynei]|uniref:Alpha-ketoglutarate-dependent dioxygenase abh1-like protein n=1 Tax=Euroglyphus maynei TaxID=6958 RepID=A0A1Y3AU75_EURMA|nr:alpha-ketoglutarate-dependent dioxygenase abh1-like protein [Euroglyphus maynei]
MANSNDEIYKTTFKLYKNWSPKSDLPLVDFRSGETYEHFFHQVNISPECFVGERETFTHFKPFDQWKIYKLIKGVDGFFIITGILKEHFRQDWFDYFHDQLPSLQEELNLKSNITLNNRHENLTKLRWITFGYHHDWNSKIYDLNQKTVRIPDRINDLCQLVSMSMNLDMAAFKPEAGIVNYYTNNSSLCFHTDHSELNHQIPLISLSLGASAIFLIGGPTKQSSQSIVPILLNDSDLVIMSGESRLAFHSVPKILASSSKYSSSRDILRINVNIRQVF